MINISCGCVEHIKNDKQLIKNFYNFAKKGGYALITVPAFSFFF